MKLSELKRVFYWSTDSLVVIEVLELLLLVSNKFVPRVVAIAEAFFIGSCDDHIVR